MQEKAFDEIQILLSGEGVVLPITTGDHGHRVIPLKPICELLELKWECQRVKANYSRMLERLGTCIAVVHYANQRRQMVCIRVDRIAYWLKTINPKQVRVNGNRMTANLLDGEQNTLSSLDLGDYMQNDFFDE